jgi:chromosome partitioning protein
MIAPIMEDIMPTIVVATPKGGAGKSTTSLVLGLTLAERGAKVTLIDADDNHPLTDWHGGRSRSVDVIGGITDSNFVSIVDREADSKDAVIVDLEGVATRVMSRAIMRADLVLIPMQPSKLDAKEAAKMVGLIRQEEEILRRPIPFRICMTRTSDAVPTRATKKLIAEMAAKGIPAMSRHLNQRVPYTSLFELNCTLSEMDAKQISGVPQAIQNANEFTDEVVELLKGIVAGRVAA